MSDDPRGGVHARLFRALLRLFPAAFRAEYGSEMTRYFLERLERARRRAGRVGVVRLWSRTVVDVVRTAGAERLERFRLTGRRTRGGHEFESTRGDGMGRWSEDLGYAVRRLARSPLFTISAVGILAVGIGANTAAFSVVDGVLFRPPPFEDPERVVAIYQDSDDGEPSSSSFPAYRDMAGMDEVFAGVGAVSPGGATWDRPDGPETVRVEYATSSYLPVLGLSTDLGRWFSEEHDQPGAAPVAVVSHRTWSSTMGGDPDVVGRTIRLNGQPVTVVGVGPEEFNGSGGSTVTDFWLSISATVVGGEFRVANLERRQDHWYTVLARLAPGVTVDRARAAMDGLARRLAEAYPELNRGRGITVFPAGEVRLHPSIDGTLFSVGVGLLAVVGMVLLLTCSNLANLLLVRGVSRSSEMAVRQAMGASRGQVTRLFVLEALLLSVLGGAAGLLVAGWAAGALSRVSLPVAGGLVLDVGVDHRVVLFSLALVLATAVLFGLAPGLRAAGTDVASTLRQEGRGASAGRGTSLLRRGLIAVQVAVSVVLLVGAGLLVRSLANVRSVDPGVDVERIAMVGTSLRQGGVSAEEAPVVRDRILERVRALPGVERAAITSRLPVQDGGSTTTVVEGYEPASGTGSVELDFAAVGRGYFETMGIDRVDGRTFDRSDGPETPTVVVVNATAARRFWGGDAVGRRIRPQSRPDDWRRVVGVVEDVKVSSLQEPPTPMIYFSAEQSPPGSFVVVARTDGDPAALTGSLRTALREVRGSLPVTRLGPFESHLGSALTGPRAAATLVGSFSLLAVILATLGIYAVVSFTVARRTDELGIRMALGADRGRVVAMVVKEALLTAGVGILAGLGLAAAATPALERLLFRVGALDPYTFGMGALLLLLVAAAASWIPARRAARTDPVEVLRGG